MIATTDPIPNVIVHSCLSIDLDFDHPTALRTVLEDCTDEQIIAEIAIRKFDKQLKAVLEQVHEKYHFERVIGKGASGVVHLVFEKETGKGYACKTLVPSKMNDLPSMATEIEISEKVHHDHVVRLHEKFESSQCIWLIMELMDTGALRGMLTKVGHFSEAVTCRYMMQMLEGIHYLHSEGIVHRDLKIDNILFDGEPDTGIVKIADFGLSAQIKFGRGYHPTDSTKRKKFTGMTVRWGTVTHCSPELLFKRAYGPQTDMWSLGCMMYEMLTGKQAFSLVATDRKHKNVNLYRKIRGCLYNRELLKDISPLGIHFLESLIEINPTKRFAASEALCHPWLKYHNIVPYSFSCQIEPKTHLFSVFSRVLVTNVLRTDSFKEKTNNLCDSCSNNVQTNQNVLDMKRCTLLNAGNVRDSLRELKHIKEQKLKENRNIIHDNVSTKVNRRSSVISRLVNRFRMALVL